MCSAKLPTNVATSLQDVFHAIVMSIQFVCTSTTQFPQFDASFVMRCRQSCCHLHFWSCYIVRMVTNFDHSTVKHARQNIENDCHQWLSRSFAPYCTLYLLVTKNKVVFLRSVCCNIFFLTRANRRASLSRQHTT